MKNKKLFFALIFIAFLSLVLVGCKKEHVHEYGDWNVTINATCTTDGLKERSCNCGEKESEVIQATGHNYGEWSVTTPVTCTVNGLKEKVCANCGDKQTETIVATGEHVYGDWTITQNADCTTNGSRERSCGCGDKQVEVIQATGHAFTKHNQEANEYCVSEYYSCSNCNKNFSKSGEEYTVITSDVTSKHTFTNKDEEKGIVVTTWPTATTDGLLTYNCNKCDHTHTAVLKAYSVAQASALAASDEVVLVKGVVLSGVSTASNLELLLKDESTNNVIGISNIDKSIVGEVDKLELKGWSKGNVVNVLCTVKEASTLTTDNKVLADGGRTYLNSMVLECNVAWTDTKVLESASTTVPTTFDKTNVPVITSQDDLVAFLKADTLKTNEYKLVKLTGKFYLIKYSSSSSTKAIKGNYIRFYFDSSIKKVDNQKIDGTFSPVFKDENTKSLTGKTFTELTSLTIGTDWNSPVSFNGEVYAVFFGGNNSYAQFVVVNGEDFVNLDVYQYNEQNHWNLNGANKKINETAHTFDEDPDHLIVDVAPTCTEAGSGHYVCKGGCGYEKEVVINPTGHSYGNWTYDAESDKHVRVCANNSEHTESENCEYVQDTEKQNEAPTCMFVGHNYKACSVCGHKKTEDVDKLNDHEPSKVNAVLATATEDGVMEYYHCETCFPGKYFVKDGTGAYVEKAQTDLVVKACAHVYELAYSQKAATCTEDGYSQDIYRCTNEGCNYYFIGEGDTKTPIASADLYKINALGHTPQATFTWGTWSHDDHFADPTVFVPSIKIVCSVCQTAGEATVLVDTTTTGVTVADEKTLPTCTVDGTIVLTASYEYNESPFEDVKTITKDEDADLKALEHDITTLSLTKVTNTSGLVDGAHYVLANADSTFMLTKTQGTRSNSVAFNSSNPELNKFVEKDVEVFTLKIDSDNNCYYLISKTNGYILATGSTTTKVYYNTPADLTAIGSSYKLSISFSENGCVNIRSNVTGTSGKYKNLAYVTETIKSVDYSFFRLIEDAAEGSSLTPSLCLYRYTDEHYYPAVAETCTTDGNFEYYTCNNSGCNCKFNASGEDISESYFISKTGHDFEYTLTWNRDYTNLTVSFATCKHAGCEFSAGKTPIPIPDTSENATLNTQVTTIGKCDVDQIETISYTWSYTHNQKVDLSVSGSIVLTRKALGHLSTYTPATGITEFEDGVTYYEYKYGENTTTTDITNDYECGYYKVSGSFDTGKTYYTKVFGTTISSWPTASVNGTLVQTCTNCNHTGEGQTTIQYISVSDALAQEEPDDTFYILKAIVIGVVSSGSNNGLLVQDLSTSDVIVIRGFRSSHLLNSDEEPAYFNRGDYIEIPVSFGNTTAGGSDNGMRVAYSRIGETNTTPQIVEKTLDPAQNVVQIKLIDETNQTKYTVIDSQEDLEAFLMKTVKVDETDTTVIKNENYYKMVKIDATDNPLYFTCTSTGTLRFSFGSMSTGENPTLTKMVGYQLFKDSKGDIKTAYPCFLNSNVLNSTGSSGKALLFGNAEFDVPSSNTNAVTFYGTIYAVFMGGNIYNMMFDIISENDVILSNPVYEANAVTVTTQPKTEYSIGDSSTLDFTGGTITVVAKASKDCVTVPITADMIFDRTALDAKTENNVFNSEGENITVTFRYVATDANTEFTITYSVTELVTSITMPTTTKMYYTELDTDGKVKTSSIIGFEDLETTYNGSTTVNVSSLLENGFKFSTGPNNDVILKKGSITIEWDVELILKVYSISEVYSMAKNTIVSTFKGVVIGLAGDDSASGNTNIGVVVSDGTKAMLLLTDTSIDSSLKLTIGSVDFNYGDEITVTKAKVTTQGKLISLSSDSVLTLSSEDANTAENWFNLSSDQYTVVDSNDDLKNAIYNETTKTKETTFKIIKIEASDDNKLFITKKSDNYKYCLTFNYTSDSGLYQFRINSSATTDGFAFIQNEVSKTAGVNYNNSKYYTGDIYLFYYLSGTSSSYPYAFFGAITEGNTLVRNDVS